MPALAPGSGAAHHRPHATNDGSSCIAFKEHSTSRALSGGRAWLSSVTEPTGRGTLAEGTGAGPAAQQGLQLAKQLPQRQADAAGFGRPSRSRVRKPWATATRSRGGASRRSCDPHSGPAPGHPSARGSPARWSNHKRQVLLYAAGAAALDLVASAAALATIGA